MSEPRDPTAGGPAGDDPTAAGAYGNAAAPDSPPPPAHSAAPEPSADSGTTAYPAAPEPPADSGTTAYPADPQPPADSGTTAYPAAPGAGAYPYGGAAYGTNPYAGDPPAPPGYSGSAPWRSGAEDTTWAVLAHVLGIFFSVFAPLVVLIAKGGSSGFVRDQAVEALNFQITVLLAYVVSAILIILVIGLIMFFFVGVASLILGIVAATAASRGEAYRYPINLRLIR